jgi:CheY-like chemotaxis protein
MHPAPAPYVLYVEDDRINIVLMEEVFRRLPGWRLDCAEDGEQALALLPQGMPDLVLIDMNLPDMTGLDLLRKLRGEPATAALRCVALSADDLAEQVELALQAGFSDYWLKPIDVERLAQSLKATLPLETLELKSMC